MPATEVFAAGLTVLLTFAPAAGPHQAFAAKCPNADTAPATRNREAITRATLCLVNAERRSRGLRILRSSPRLSRAARRHARDMVRRHYFSHTTPGGVTLARRIGRTGYFRTTDTWFVGETLAWGTEARGTAQSVLRAWMHSRQHRKVLVGRPFRDIGVGVALGVPRRQLTGGATYAVDFGVRH